MRRSRVLFAAMLLASTGLVSGASGETTYFFRTDGAASVTTGTTPPPPGPGASAPVRFSRVQTPGSYQFGDWSHQGVVHLSGDALPLSLDWDPEQPASPFASNVSISPDGSTMSFVTQGGCSAAGSLSPTSDPLVFDYSLSVTAPGGDQDTDCSTQPLGLVAADDEANVAHWASAAQIESGQPQNSTDVAISNYQGLVSWQAGRAMSDPEFLTVTPGDLASASVSPLYAGRWVNCEDVSVAEQYQCRYVVDADGLGATFTALRQTGESVTVVYDLVRGETRDEGGGPATSWTLTGTQSGDLTLQTLAVVPLVATHSVSGQTFRVGSAEPRFIVVPPPVEQLPPPRIVDAQGNDVTDAQETEVATPSDGTALDGYVAKSRSPVLYMSVLAHFERDWRAFREIGGEGERRPEEYASGTDTGISRSLSLPGNRETYSSDNGPHIDILPSASTNSIEYGRDGWEWIRLYPISGTPDADGLYSFQLDVSILMGPASKVHGGGSGDCREWTNAQYSNVSLIVMTTDSPNNGLISRAPNRYRIDPYGTYRENDPPFCMM